MLVQTRTISITVKHTIMCNQCWILCTLSILSNFELVCSFPSVHLYEVEINYATKVCKYFRHTLTNYSAMQSMCSGALVFITDMRMIKQNNYQYSLFVSIIFNVSFRTSTFVWPQRNNIIAAQHSMHNLNLVSKQIIWHKLKQFSTTCNFKVLWKKNWTNWRIHV